MRFTFLLPLVFLAAVRLDAADSVRVVSKGTIRTVTGTIVELDRKKLVLSNGDQTRTFSTTAVVQLQTIYRPSHQKALQQRARGEWSQAIQNLNLALKFERRDWVRQRILRELAITHRNSDDIPRSAEIALALYQQFPNTNQTDALPLAWKDFSVRAAVQKQAETWLASRRPEAQLLGASWLLSGSTRRKSVNALKRLTNEAEPWLAKYATAQLWRIEMGDVRATTCARWERLIAQMPPEMRAGPLWLLGQGWQQVGDAQQASIALMKLPVLHADEPLLAVTALMQVAELGKDADQRTSAYREVVTKYPFTRQSKLARQQLDDADPLKNPTSKLRGTPRDG